MSAVDCSLQPVRPDDAVSWPCSRSRAIWLCCGDALLPLGFAIQAVGLLKTKALPRWQSALFLVGVLFVGFPDGAEIVNLTASILMAVALIPYGVRMIAGKGSAARTAAAVRHGFRMREAHPDLGR
jgi:hypothetical protein